MSCHTQEEIAERENVVKSQVNEICSEMAKLPESKKPAANHQVDFDLADHPEMMKRITRPGLLAPWPPLFFCGKTSPQRERTRQKHPKFQTLADVFHEISGCFEITC